MKKAFYIVAALVGLYLSYRTFKLMQAGETLLSAMAKAVKEAWAKLTGTASPAATAPGAVTNLFPNAPAPTAGDVLGGVQTVFSNLPTYGSILQPFY